MDLESRQRYLEEKERMPAVVRVLIADAIKAGWWIQDNRTFEWYSPDEFNENWRRLFEEGKRGDSNIKRFSVRDPMMGERVIKRKMRDAMADYLNFRNRLESYYEFDLKPRKK